MKHILLFSFLLLGSFPLFAQQTQRAYSYDAAGNRISRSVVILRTSLQQADSVSERIENEGISNSLVTCKVTVYPNPTLGEVNLSISSGEEEATSEIAVYNDSGQLLTKLQAKGNTTLPIDLSSYAKGIYLLNFQQGENKSFYKIIKQ